MIVSICVESTVSQASDMESVHGGIMCYIMPIVLLGTGSWCYQSTCFRRQASRHGVCIICFEMSCR